MSEFHEACFHFVLLRWAIRALLSEDEYHVAVCGISTVTQQRSIPLSGLLDFLLQSLHNDGMYYLLGCSTWLEQLPYAISLRTACFRRFMVLCTTCGRRCARNVAQSLQVYVMDWIMPQLCPVATVVPASLDRFCGGIRTNGSESDPILLLQHMFNRFVVIMRPKLARLVLL